MTALTYFQKLYKGMHVKNLDQMWPVGTVQVGAKFGACLARNLEQALRHHSADHEPENAKKETFPTTYLVVGAFIVFGTLHERWSVSRITRLIESYLQYASSRKHGDLFNSDGRNVILNRRSRDSLINTALQDGSCDILDFRKLNAISTYTFAAAESLYYCCHRICTEKHGPYGIAANSDVYLIRSCMNLQPPKDLWPECWELMNDTPDSFEIVWRIKGNGTKFDMFSNIIHNYDVNVSTLYAGIMFSDCDAFSYNNDRLDDLKLTLKTVIQRSSEITRKLSPELRAHRLTGILCYANRRLFESAGMNWRGVWNDCTILDKNRYDVIEYDEMVSKLQKLIARPMSRDGGQ